MSSGTIKLYSILVDKGVEREIAMEAVSEFITRDEAASSLATKQDIAKLVMWMAGLLVGQTATIVAVIALFF
jgi:hypothetical protein